jgi:hypothetical protein
MIKQNTATVVSLYTEHKYKHTTLFLCTIVSMSLWKTWYIWFHVQTECSYRLVCVNVEFSSDFEYFIHRCSNWCIEILLGQSVQYSHKPCIMDWKKPHQNIKFSRIKIWLRYVKSWGSVRLACWCWNVNQRYLYGWMFFTLPELVKESVSNKLGELPTGFRGSVHVQSTLAQDLYVRLIHLHWCTCMISSNQWHGWPTRQLV